MKDIDSIRTPFGFGITVDNVNEALPLGLQLVNEMGVPTVSRGIETLEVPGPVTTVYRNPQRRVLFDEVRDANPFFHLVDSMWMLSGSNRADLLALFLESITQFSDDGDTFHGAYGHRLRSGPVDQLAGVVALLREKPDTRQAVCSIWQPNIDLGAKTKDMPCNDMLMFRIWEDKLNLTVCNRSNDVIWGAYGANAVQFSILQEWVAARLNVPMGKYVQMSNSYHVYPSNPFWTAFLKGEHATGHVYNPYMNPDVQPYALANGPAEALAVQRDAEYLDMIARCDGASYEELAKYAYTSSFFQFVVVPMIEGYAMYKDGKHIQALKRLSDIVAVDWRVACTAWVLRRKERAERERA